MIVSDLLENLGGIQHGFFTRRGGVSKGIYDSLNCSFKPDDPLQNVQENRLRVAAKLGIEHAAPLTVRQVHSNRAIVADTAWTSNEAPEADAIVTATRGLPIGVTTADCTPILFCDAEAGVIGAAHAGWRGAKTGIIETVIDVMETQGARRARICAAIGPTISQNAYEVGPEFESAFLNDDEVSSRFFMQFDANGKPHFDLPAYCVERLSNAGVVRIDNLGLCTYQNESLFFSYRRSVHREEEGYGCQISAIVIM